MNNAYLQFSPYPIIVMNKINRDFCNPEVVYPSFGRKETHRENEKFYTPLNLFEKDVTVVLFYLL